jgi:hypothetical protein
VELAMTPEDKLNEAVLAYFDALMQQNAAKSKKVDEEMDQSKQR